MDAGKTIAIVMAIFMLFTACVNEEIHVPDDVLQPEQMKLVMIDIHKAQAGLEMTEPTPDVRAQKASEQYASVLKQHQLTPEEFFRNYRFYQQHPLLMDSLYRMVLVDLEMQLQMMP